MSTPDDLLAVAALHRCMAARDYAGAARLVTKQATLDGLTSLARPAWRTAAEQAYRESVAAWRAEHEATMQRQVERGIATLVALCAQVLEDGRCEDRGEAPEIPDYDRALAARNRALLAAELAACDKRRKVAPLALPGTASAA